MIEHTRSVTSQQRRKHSCSAGRITRAQDRARNVRSAINNSLMGRAMDLCGVVSCVREAATFLFRSAKRPVWDGSNGPPGRIGSDGSGGVTEDWK